MLRSDEESKLAGKRRTAAKSRAKSAMGHAKTAGRSVKKAATRGAKNAVLAERAMVKAAKGAVAATPSATGAKRKRKTTVASIAAKARRQNAKTDYNPLHMLAKLSPF